MRVKSTINNWDDYEVLFDGEKIPELTSLQLIEPPEYPILLAQIHATLNMTREMIATQRFQPGPTQIVSLMIGRRSIYADYEVLSRSRFDCQTVCKAGSCECKTRDESLEKIDHLTLMVNQLHHSCFCGLTNVRSS